MAAQTSDIGGKFVATNNINLHYLEVGQGRPMVVMHGITGAAETWMDRVVMMQDRYRMIIPDLRGHGLSDKPASGYQLTDYAADIAGLIRGMGLGQPIVMGHSMGARIVAQIAADYPNTIGAGILIDPPSGGPGRRLYPSTLEMMRERRADLERRGEASLRERFPNNTDEYIRVRARWGLMYSMRAVEESWRGFHGEEIYSILPQMRCPGLFLWAENGDVIRDVEAEEYRQANPTLKYVKIMRSGHGIPWDNWEDFIAAVDGFTAEL